MLGSRERKAPTGDPGAGAPGPSPAAAPGTPPAAASDPGSIRISSVSKTYETRTGLVEAVRDVTVDVEAGQFVSMVGPSGCGKSTLLNMVAGLAPTEEGRIAVSGSPAAPGRRDTGIMLQAPVLLPWRTVLDNVLLPVEVFGGDKKAARERARGLLKLVGLEGFEKSYAWELSGGMQQRASLARVLVFEPSILLMDEPFAALDELTREQLLAELARLHAELRRTVLYVTHNILESVFLSDRVVVMSAHPGEVLDIVEVGLPRPRSLSLMDDSETNELVARVRGLLHGERGEGG